MNSEFDLAGLSPDQRLEMLEELLNQEADGSEFATSYAQERLWVLDQLTPGNPVYNISAAIRMRGRISVPLIERSMNILIERHETLRTALVKRDGRPMQRILDPWSMQVTVCDLSEVLPGDLTSRIDEEILRFTSRSFDLESGQLVRVGLLRISDLEHIALFTMHHAVSDGWSLGVLTKEFTECYKALVQGVEPVFDELEIQYADYAVWQKDSENEAFENQQVAYWRDLLSNAPVLELPTDFPRQQSTGNRGASVVVSLDAEVWTELKKISGRHAATPFMTLLAALKLQLARLSGQDDVVVGTPVAGRNRQELEGLIGCFLNTLAIRSSVEPNQTFGELLTHVRNNAMGAFSHQDVPFERLLEEVPVDRSSNRTPFFQVMLNLMSFDLPEMDLPGVKLEHVELPEHMAKFDITLYATPKAAELELRLVYNADLFTAERAKIMLDQYVWLLKQIARSPNQELSSFSLVCPSTLRNLPDPAQPIVYMTLPTVNDLFLLAVEQNPSGVAVEHVGRQLSYSELASLVDQICEEIDVRSDAPEAVVAVFGEKSVEIVAAMLAIQKSGRILLCIDPNLPAERQSEMLRLAGTSLLIRITATENGALQKIGYESLPGGSLPCDYVQNPDDRPAYIFYTSGSTGKPKAILGSSQALSHFLMWQRQTFGIDAIDRIAQLTALSFDVVLRDVFLPLISGATLCIPNSSDAVLSPTIVQWLDRQRITAMHSVPSLMRHWLSGDHKQTCPTLRWLFSAGEPLSDTLCGALAKTFSNAQIVNLYGPTETTLAKCFKIIDENPTSGIQSVGRTLPEAQALVLAEKRLCGVGEPGEIAIRTPYRSYGYLDRTIESQTNFRANPFTEDPLDLVYYTGDRGRYLPNGELEILGRLDDQVKIRGVRVEPAEVAATIARYDAVKSCVVLAAANDSGEKFLVAYCVAKDDARLSEHELAAYLAERLPNAMVPELFIFLPELPLLPNGKVNRRSLPRPDAVSRTALTAEIVEPRTKIEAAILAIWEEVLRRKPISTDASFFTVGGHSLLAAQVMARIESQLNIALPLRVIFEGPTIRKLAVRIETADKSDHHALPPITRRSTTDESPLSLAQEALWFLDAMNPQSGAYTTYPMLRVRGLLSISALQLALHEVISRHEVLRTTFPQIDGRPVQRIALPSMPNIGLTDLSDQDDETQKRNIEAWIGQRTSQGIDLQNGPIIRLDIAKLSETEHIILVAWHHIVHDGWSLGVLAREILTAYEDIRHDRSPNLPALPIQYADWAVWQRSILQGDRLAKLQEYWREKLREVPALDLVTDRPRPSIRTTRGDSVEISMSPKIAARVRECSRANGVTPFMVFLAAFQLTLARFSGQNDFAIGSPVANRRKHELEGLIGYFINMLVLRTNLDGADTFEAVLHRTQQTVLDAFEHQDLTLDQVVGTVNPPRDSSRHPLFQVMFVLHNNAPLAGQNSELAFEPLNNSPSHSSYFDLNLVLQEHDDTYTGRLVYNVDLFKASTIQRIVESMHAILEQATEDATVAPAHIELRSSSDKELIQSFEFPAGQPIQYSNTSTCLHTLFEQAARTTPQKVAIVDGNVEFSYSDLNAAANQFARHLHSVGVQPGMLVAIQLPRSIDLFVALLGVLKAGAGYLPLDEKAPASRNCATLLDSKVKHLISNSIEDAYRELDLSFITQVRKTNQIDLQSQENLVHTLAPEATAYVIYTSGSTGQPKGVVLSHRAVVAYVLAATDAYGVRDEDRLLQFASISFDAHVEEVFLALLNNATLVLRDNSMLDSVRKFLQSCKDHKISVLSLPTGFWHEIVHEADAKSLLLPSNIRTIIIGGEAALPDRLRQWFKLGSNIRLLNSYGPTETTVVATVTELLPDNMHSERLPIGRPMNNTTAYVLDQNRQPVPIGVRGELYLGGLSVADGYLHRDELTAEKFVADRFELQLFGERDNIRMYRTGDIVCWREDGRLEFFGRADHQVKIRGFRIELSEIEIALRKHSSVRDAVVVVEQTVNGDPQIGAYIVSSGPTAASSDELRGFLAGSLPAHMLPAIFVSLPAIPLTSSGKVNRKALPPLNWEASAVAHELVPACSPTEAIVAELFAEVLGRDRVSATDDFFALGGSSLIGLRLVSKLRDRFAIDLPMSDLFANPTVRAIATQIDTLQSIELVSDRIDFKRAAVSFRSEMSYGQQRFWFLQQLNPGTSAYNFHAAVVIRGPVEFDLLQQTIDTLVDRHESLRTSFEMVQDVPMQVVGASSTKAQLEFVDLSSQDAATDADYVRAKAVEFASQPFDLTAAPVLRVALMQIASAEYVLVFAAHHIVIDAWSMQIMLREISVIYEALVRGRPHYLPTLGYRYRDFSEWQRRMLNGETRAGLVEFWRRKLADVEPLRMPADHTHSSHKSRGERLAFSLPADLHVQARRFAQQQGVTTFVLHLAVLNILLQRYAQQSDISIAVPISGRHRTETQSIVGFFVNTIVLRNQVSDSVSFLHELNSIRESTVEAFQHQDLPFDQLVAELKPDRSSGQHPFAQVMLNVIQASGSALTNRAGGISIEAFLTGETEHNAEFALMLNLVESSDSLSGWWGYDASMFDESTIAAISNQYQALLQSAINGPENAVGELNALPAEERRQLLESMNNTTRAYRTQTNLHDLVLEQAAKTPHTTAIESAQGAMTFEALAAKSNDLAHRLVSLGVTRNTLVPICFDRSSDAIVSMLAVLRAGGAFVSVDPQLPTERIQQIVTDCQSKIAVTSQEHRSKLERARIDTICLIEDSSDGKISPDALPNVHPEDLAYAIFTSGSTGKPKGVLVEHRSVVNVVQSFIETYRTGPADRILHNTSLSFDVSINEIFPALCSGATIVIPTKDERLDVDGLANFVNRYSVSIVAAAPTVLARLNAAQTKMPSLRHILSGGEALHFDDVNFLAQHATVTNGYGPTETTICATSYQVTSGQRNQHGIISIGKPLPNYQVYVLDSRQRLLSRGCLGELYIGGIGVARGYLNDHALTSERFIAAPWDKSQRIYRTGDLVRWLPDGNLAFFGRVDRQVKIRGFRIELGEIEAVLAAHINVREIAVLDVDFNGDRRLVAYCVAKDPDHTGELEKNLREFAAAKLPEYMIPSAVVVLDHLPLTVSGKVDRRSLPKPDQNAATARTIAAPSNDVERELVELWQQTLGVESVSVDDNFFDLGGHSLLVVKMGGQIRSKYKVDIPVSQLFSAPTIRTVARLIGDAIESKQEIEVSPKATRVVPRSDVTALSPIPPEEYLVRLNSESKGLPIFCIHGLGGHIVNFIPFARELMLQRPVFALQGLGIDGRHDPHDDLVKMATVYCDAIRSQQASGPYQLIGWSMGGLLAMEIGRQLLQANEQVSPLILLDTHLSLRDRSLEAVTDESVVKQIAPRLGIPLKSLRKLSIEKQWNLILEKSRVLGDEKVNDSSAAEIRRLATVCKAHLQAIAAHTVVTYPGEAILVQAVRPVRPVDPRWKKICQRFTSFQTAGSHYSMMAKPEVVELASLVERVIVDPNRSSGGKL